MHIENISSNQCWEVGSYGGIFSRVASFGLRLLINCHLWRHSAWGTLVCWCRCSCNCIRCERLRSNCGADWTHLRLTPSCVAQFVDVLVFHGIYRCIEFVGRRGCVMWTVQSLWFQKAFWMRGLFFKRLRSRVGFCVGWSRFRFDCRCVCNAPSRNSASLGFGRVVCDVFVFTMVCLGWLLTSERRLDVNTSCLRSRFWKVRRLFCERAFRGLRSVVLRMRLRLLTALLRSHSAWWPSCVMCCCVLALQPLDPKMLRNF